MADDADMAQSYEQAHLSQSLKRITARPAMEPGVQGECDLCGEWSGRLVRGVCAPCRDKYRLP